MEKGLEDAVFYHVLAVCRNAFCVKIRLNGDAFAHRIVGDRDDIGCDSGVFLACEQRHTHLRALCRECRGEGREDGAHLLAIEDDVHLAGGDAACADLGEGFINGILGDFSKIKTVFEFFYRVVVFRFAVLHNDSHCHDGVDAAGIFKVKTMGVDKADGVAAAHGRRCGAVLHGITCGINFFCGVERERFKRCRICGNESGHVRLGVGGGTCKNADGVFLFGVFCVFDGALNEAFHLCFFHEFRCGIAHLAVHHKTKAKTACHTGGEGADFFIKGVNGDIRRGHIIDLIFGDAKFFCRFLNNSFQCIKVHFLPPTVILDTRMRG